MSQPTHKIKLEALIGVFFGIIILYIVVAFALDYFEETHFLNKYSGTLESIFSSLAFAGLLYTIYQQQVTIQTQVVEMRETRQQAIDANEIFKRQTDLLEIQELSNGFFKHYDVSHRLLILIDVEVDGQRLKGNQYFDYLVNRFYDGYHNRIWAKSSKELDAMKVGNVEERQFEELTLWFFKFEETRKFYSTLLPYLKSLVLNVEYFLNTKFKNSKDKDYYGTLLRFSIEPKAAKLICFIYLWSDGTKYPDFYHVINELTLWAHFNHSSQEIDVILKRKIKEELNQNRPNEIEA